MEIWSQLYFNFFFVGSFIVFSVCAAFAVFLLRLKNKSSATRHFGIALAFLAVFNAAYLIPYSIYHPLAAYHRWITVGTILPALLHFSQFLLRFPDCDHPRFTRFMLWAQWLIHIGICSAFIFISSQTGTFFNVQGHYFDLDADAISTIQSGFILAYIMFSVFIGIWRCVIRRGVQRWALLAQALILFFVMMIPAVLNSLSRDGRVSRELFQNAYAIFLVIGLFIMVVVFLNTTPDRTSFMSKIIGISLATFLLIMQVLSYRTLSRRDADFDTLKKEEAGRVLLGGKAPADLVWLRSVNLKTGQLKTHNGAAPLATDANLLFFTAWREGVGAPEISKHLTGAGTKIWFTYLNQWVAAKQSQGDRFALLEEKFSVLKHRLSRLTPQNFRQRADALLAKQEGAEQDAADFIRQEMRSSRLEAKELRQNVTEKFVLPLKSGSRAYPEKNGQQFVSFRWYDAASGSVLEAGYSYLQYRAYIRDAALDFFLLTLGGLFLLLTVFPVFFYLALVDPLKALLTGVSRVNEGNLESEVKVVVEDEIGTLARSFNNMMVSIREARQKLQEYAVELEAKVRERTQSLEQTLGQVQELKKQQDGDYFLTSLMLNPLGSNNAASELYQIEFLVKQKKQFDFKHWHAEIGGDICVADHIRLRDEDYIVVLNADAMGKSMQGAGGAVVLGSAFHALLDRCRLSRTESHRYPETWIRDAFVELHKIFAVFDGSMLVSVFLGLIHEKSGAMFYTNAEHPWPVLLRNGHAEFLKTTIFFRKLGIIPGTGKYPWKELRDDSLFLVDTFQLKPADVLLIGSDGRDDLLIGSAADKGRIINEDENIFRAMTEKTGGNLRELFSELGKAGEFTDDLSLIRVAANFTPEQAAATDASTLAELSSAYRRKDFARALQLADNVVHSGERSAARARILFRQGNMAAALSEAAHALAVNPLKTDLIYLQVRAYKKLRNYEEAHACAERYRLRRPTHTGNLLQLSHLSALLKLDRDARTYAEEALRLDSSLQAAERILEFIATGHK
ncbi:MAG: SpoIIE family protein phosphatase [Leptospiraceae bacterium]|nr:SpoIIE family protein phosphatase [Leptospiraceae bacterium]